MVWIIIVVAIVVVAAVVAFVAIRSRARARQLEEGREHREVTRRQARHAQADEIEERVGPLDDGR